jgi:hypothetical protein
MSGTNGKSRVSARYGADVERRGGVLLTALAGGLWTARAHGPIEIADPEKARALIQRHGLPELRMVGHARTWLSSIERVLRAAPPRVRWELERLVSGGGLQWAEAWENLVVDSGLDDYLDKYFRGAAYTAAHFIGLTDGTPTAAAGDTMASHAGWAEVTDYDEATREAYVPGAVAGQSVDNAASKASFSLNAGVTVGGAFATTANTKGGATGTLVSVGAFSAGDRALQNGDTLNVTATFTQAAA